MAEVRLLRVPWATLWKVLTLVVLVWLWLRLWPLVMLVLVAIIIAVGLAPVVGWLESKRLPRWAAAGFVTLLIAAVIVSFLVISWSSLTEQATDLGGRLRELEQEITSRAPEPILNLIRQAEAKSDASLAGPYVLRAGRALVNAAGVIVLAFILVFYLLVEAQPTFQWVRHFVPARYRPRFDQTAREMQEVAYGFVVGNVVTSACAGIYVYAVLTPLGVPGSLLLALLAFLFDFVPVLGFVLSVVPAMVMAATVSPTLALAMVPIFLFYDFLENYFIGPRVYSERLELSKTAVLLAFAVGAQLAGVVGALLALPMAATFPTIDRLWLRKARNSQEDEGES